MVWSSMSGPVKLGRHPRNAVIQPEAVSGTCAVVPPLGHLSPTRTNALGDYPSWKFDDSLNPREREYDASRWLQAVGLSSHQDYSIPSSIRSVQMGLGWDRTVDVDASVALFDKNLRTVDIVWYKKLQSTCRSVVHSGDNLTGVGDGDDEGIFVHLAEIPFHVHHPCSLLFAFSALTFPSAKCTRLRIAAAKTLTFHSWLPQIKSAYVRMLCGDQKHKHQEMCRFSLTRMSGHSMLMGMLTRKGPRWSFRALGVPATGRTIRELLLNPNNLRCLSDSRSHSPELRRVSINVIKGADLAAKDRAGIFRRTASSDPYFVIHFRNKTFTSEYKPKTLNPEWKCLGFDLGYVTEVETEALKIELFDYNALGADDFMGIVRVSGYALFNLGPGEHIFWFQLCEKKENKYKNETVSGKILVSITVEAVNTEPRLF